MSLEIRILPPYENTLRSKPTNWGPTLEIPRGVARNRGIVNGRGTPEQQPKYADISTVNVSEESNWPTLKSTPTKVRANTPRSYPMSENRLAITTTAHDVIVGYDRRFRTARTPCDNQPTKTKCGLTSISSIVFVKILFCTNILWKYDLDRTDYGVVRRRGNLHDESA